MHDPTLAILEGYLLRGSLVYAVGNAILLNTTIQAELAPKPIGWVSGILTVMGVICLNVASVGLGAVIAVGGVDYFLPNHVSYLVLRASGAIGGLAGLFTGRIAFQYFQNFARLIYGLAPKKIIWLKTPTRKRHRLRTAED